VATPELFTFEIDAGTDPVGITPTLQTVEVEATGTDTFPISPRLRTLEIEAYSQEVTFTMGIDGKQLKNATVTAAKLTFTPVEDGGLAWREPVDVLHLVGNLGEAALEGLTPTAGDAYVVSAVDGDGTLNPGGVTSLAVGDVVEYSGSAWARIAVGSGGFVASGVRAVLATQTALVSPYTDAADDGKVVEFDGTSLTGAATGESVDGYAVLVNGDGGLFENKGYVFSGAVPTGSWLTFGAGTLTAGDGIDILSGVVSTDLLASGGLKIVSTELGVEPAPITFGWQRRATASREAPDLP
jgi:hypothetical protein